VSSESTPAIGKKMSGSCWSWRLGVSETFRIGLYCGPVLDFHSFDVLTDAVNNAHSLRELRLMSP
jgi:hypothetical protein